MKPTLYPNGFPSAYEELKTFYPVFYRDVFEMDAIWRAAGGGLDEIEDGVDAVVNNNFVSLMDTDTPLILQGVIGSVIVTGAELATGMILNVWLGLGVWDYSGMPLNYKGQICLPFSILWIFVSIAAVVLDDWLRYWLFGEERPHYTLFRRGESR